VCLSGGFARHMAIGSFDCSARAHAQCSHKGGRATNRVEQGPTCACEFKDEAIPGQEAAKISSSSTEEENHSMMVVFPCSVPCAVGFHARGKQQNNIVCRIGQEGCFHSSGMDRFVRCRV
jgi:hypothetical protein